MHRRYPTTCSAILVLMRIVGVYAIANQEKDAVGLDGPKEQHQYSRKLLNSRVLNTVDVYSTVQITSDKCETTSTGLGIRQKIPENECQAYALSIGEEFDSASYQGGSLPTGCYKLKSDNKWYFGISISSSGSACNVNTVAACACRFFSYQEFKDGDKCHNRVGYENMKDKTECKNYGKVSGVKQVGYASNYAFSSASSNTVAGCHAKFKNHAINFFFQSNEETGGSCKSNHAGMCICKMTTPYNYVLRTSGRCTDNGALITSAWHCKVAAKMMGFSSYGSTSAPANQLIRPSGCHSYPFPSQRPPS